MRLFGKVFGFLLGLLLVAHGIALIALQSPLIATSNRRGAILYFVAVESLFGKTGAWILSGLLWIALGLGIAYASVIPARLARPQKPVVASPGLSKHGCKRDKRA